MNYSTRVLGASIVKTLQARSASAMLTIGKDVFTRADMARVECWNFLAAARLSRIVNRELHVKDTRDLFERVPPASLAVPEIGAISLAVLGAAFEAKGLGGAAPLEAWVRKHAEDPERGMVTFHTLKAREAQERRGEQKATQARKAARRRKAHAVRVDRFTQRQDGGV